MVFLGTILNFKDGTIHTPERRIANLKTSLIARLIHRTVMARNLASITGQIISMWCAVGNISRLLTRSCYAVECCPYGSILTCKCMTVKRLSTHKIILLYYFQLNIILIVACTMNRS